MTDNDKTQNDDEATFDWGDGLGDKENPVISLSGKLSPSQTDNAYEMNVCISDSFDNGEPTFAGLGRAIFAAMVHERFGWGWFIHGDYLRLFKDFPSDWTGEQCRAEISEIAKIVRRKVGPHDSKP